MIEFHVNNSLENIYMCAGETNYAVKVTGADITPFPVKKGENVTFTLTAFTGDATILQFFLNHEKTRSHCSKVFKQ